MSRFDVFDLNRITSQSVVDRVSKVHTEDFASPATPGASFAAFYDSLPQILAGKQLRQSVDAIVAATERKKPVVVSMGAHVIKCGLSPVLIDLIERDVISAIAMNGAGAIHDTEIALFSQTSEDVVSGLRDGSFGMARETADFLNGAAISAREEGVGLGEMAGKALLRAEGPSVHQSILAACARAGIPATVHVGIGTDIVHMHPSACGASYGEASLRDFRILTACLEGLPGGGVLMNVGSAVVLPEVILKGFAILRSAGVELSGFTSINLDFIQQYRSGQQVVHRTTELGAMGIALTGHHELLVPLIAHAVLHRLRLLPAQDNCSSF